MACWERNKVNDDVGNSDEEGERSMRRGLQLNLLLISQE